MLANRHFEASPVYKGGSYKLIGYLLDAELWFRGFDEVFEYKAPGEHQKHLYNAGGVLVESTTIEMLSTGPLVLQGH